MADTMMDASKIFPFETKDVNEEERTFSGYASTWDMDLGGDIIESGAFKRTLSHWRRSKSVLPLKDSHSYGSVRDVVGKMMEAEEDSKGLLATFEVIDGPDGDEIFRRVKGGYVDGLSIGYTPVKIKYPETEEERKKGIYRYLKEVKLREVSVVQMPMNPNARIDVSSVKSLLLSVQNSENLTDEEKIELAEIQKRIGVLLQEPGPTPEQLEALQKKLFRLKLDRLVTRSRATRHSARAVLVP